MLLPTVRLTFAAQNTERERINCSCGSLDEDPGLRPEHHIFWESQAVWWSAEDNLPRFTEYHRVPDWQVLNA